MQGVLDSEDTTRLTTAKHLNIFLDHEKGHVMIWESFSSSMKGGNQLPRGRKDFKAEDVV